MWTSKAIEPIVRQIEVCLSYESGPNWDRVIEVLKTKKWEWEREMVEYDSRNHVEAPLEELEFTTKVMNALRLKGVHTVGQLLKMEYHRFTALDCVGPRNKKKADEALKLWLLRYDPEREYESWPFFVRE